VSDGALDREWSTVDDPRAVCPKHMAHGPCGGVADDGGCEVAGIRCPYDHVVRWTGSPAPRPAPPGLGSVRWLMDLRLRRADLVRLAASAELLHGVVDAVLVGEHLDDDTGLSQDEMARWVSDHIGLPAVVTVTARDRSCDKLRDDLWALAGAGVLAVHCVTGDHPAARFGPGADASFAFDAFDMIVAAREMGLAVSAAASPASPPVNERPQRAADKVRAGAAMLVCNHAGDEAVLRRFGAALRDRCEVQLVAPVPLLSDPASIARLVQFPGLRLFPDDVATILDTDPVHAEAVGRDIAVRRARQMLALPGYTGINLSGTGPTDARHRAAMIADIVAAVDG
jgi:methylenetetrahydrofolate reductase (NADPH)